jgi:hypothetical protein
MSAPIDAKQFAVAKARADAWLRVLAAVFEQREALDYRIWREDPADALLVADVETWLSLARALADFLRARRAA